MVDNLKTINATYKGDRLATDDNYSYFDRSPIPFPSSEQKVYDTGKDLRPKIREIINQNEFRN